MSSLGTRTLEPKGLASTLEITGTLHVGEGARWTVRVEAAQPLAPSAHCERERSPAVPSLSRRRFPGIEPWPGVPPKHVRR